MKSILYMLVLTTISMIALGNTIIPQIKQPIPALQEGAQVKLTEAQIERILPWAKNIKLSLGTTLRAIENKNKIEKNSALVRGIKKAVLDNQPKNSGLLVRYVLNRALAIHEILKEKSSTGHLGSIHMSNRFLESSIIFALKYWSNDLKLLNQKQHFTHDRTLFAVNYSDFLAHMSKSIMSAKALYAITKLNLEFLQWDLYNDLNRQKKLAPVITDIYFEIQELSISKHYKDFLLLRNVRYLKKVRLRAIKQIEVTTKLISDYTKRDRLRSVKKEQARLKLEKLRFKTCQTGSTKYWFSHKSRSLEFAKQKAIFLCKEHSFTYKSDCIANIHCNDGAEYPKFKTCKTGSTKYWFSHKSRSLKFAKQKAIFLCKEHSFTYKSDCSANVICK